MNKNIVATFIVFVMSMVVLLLFGCVNPPKNGDGIDVTLGTRPNFSGEETALSSHRDEEGNYTYCEFETSDPNWTLIFRTGELFLSNGKKVFVYGDIEDVKNLNYRIDFYPVNGSESARAVISDDQRHAVIIFHDTSKSLYQLHESERGIVVELTNGFIIEDFTPNLNEIVVANTDLNPPKNKDVQWLKVSAEFSDSAVILTQSIVTNDGNIYMSHTVKPYPIDPAFESLDCDPFTKKFMTAFVNGDVEKIGEFFYNPEPDLFSNYKTLKFSGYKATVTENGTVLLTVDVAESGIDAILPGRHLYEISRGYNGIEMTDIGRVDEDYGDSKTAKFINAWLGSFEYNVIDPVSHNLGKDGVSEESLSGLLFEFLVEYIEWWAPGMEDEDSIFREDVERGLANPGEYREYLYRAEQEIFGYSNTWGYRYLFKEDENGKPVNTGGHGGTCYFYEITEVGETYVVVQFYADVSRTVESHLIRYELKKGENGSYLVPLSFDIIEESKYSPGRATT